MKEETEILIYTRNPHSDYTKSLSNSIHLAYRDGEEDFKPLNNNYGILFASGTIDENNVIHEKGLKNPSLFHTANGSFGIVAVRVDAEGNDDAESKGQILLWTSDDLATFSDCHLLKLHEDVFVKEVRCEYKADAEGYEIIWQDNTGKTYRNQLNDLMQPENLSIAEPMHAYAFKQPIVNLPNINPGNIVSVSSQIACKVKTKWQPLYHKDVHVPETVNVTSAEELRQVTATAIYSDGSTAIKKVEWDESGVDFTTPGTYTAKGKLTQENYSFPLARGYADPVIFSWNNKYYFIATNDNVSDIGLFVREGETIPELFDQGFKETVILDVDEEKGFVQTFWAPEFHIIGGELYILFAVSDKEWGPNCHMMKLNKGGDIMNPSDWSSPERVKKADGSYLAEDGITLDMTYFHVDGASYVSWSYRKGIGTPLDTGSMIYIATVAEDSPTILTSEPVLLTRPLFGWENIQGTINNEGPYPLITEDTVYLTYSGGAACGYTYAVGLLEIPRGEDYLNANAWKKASTPLLSYYSIEGVYGAGHNSFFTVDQANLMILYHVEEEIVPFGTRCSAMHRVHFNKNNEPVFNLSKERDLNPHLTDCLIKVNVE